MSWLLDRSVATAGTSSCAPAVHQRLVTSGIRINIGSASAVQRHGAARQHDNTCAWCSAASTCMLCSVRAWLAARCSRVVRASGHSGCTRPSLLHRHQDCVHVGMHVIGRPAIHLRIMELSHHACAPNVAMMNLYGFSLPELHISLASHALQPARPSTLFTHVCTQIDPSCIRHR